ncbi:MAG TPA: hypothetical protein VLB79_13570, partial [Solirubrobacterales bacterium]|nr:hypothetical protein [Solirubrobacterales bacterium]
LIGCWLAAPASASITLGQLATSIPDSDCSGDIPIDELQPTVSSGNSYIVPSRGLITSWSNRSATDPGQVLAFKVFRNEGGNTYRVVGHDGPRALVSSALNTFPTSIAVQAGDVIGLHHGDTAAQTACNFGATDTYFERNGDLLDGQFGDFHDYGPGNCCFYRLNVTAVFEPANSFTVGQIGRNKKKGTATLGLDLPNAGDLTVSGKGLKAVIAGASAAQAVQPGSASVTIKAKGKQLRKLKSTGKVKVKPTITYTPTGGHPSTQPWKLTLKKA